MEDGFFYTNKGQEIMWKKTDISLIKIQIRIKELKKIQ